METLSVESKRPFSPDLLEEILSKYWRVESSTANTLIVHGNGSRAYLHPDEDSNEAGINRLLLDYSDVQLAKKIVTAIADDPDVIVDNDFGTVLPGSKFVARCQEEEGWDWRR